MSPLAPPGEARDVSEEAPEPVLIPHRELDPQTLRRLIESFVLREGTDYGDGEYSLEKKVSHVRAQLDRGDAQVHFDPQTQTIDIRRAVKERGAGRV